MANQKYPLQRVPFDVDTLFDSAALERAKAQLDRNDLQSAIVTYFNLTSNDDHVYHAIASVSLSQIQTAVAAGRLHGLHDWYLNDAGQGAGYPPLPDIQAYIALFDPGKVAANSLKSFASNAKKNSIRTSVAQYLLSKRHIDSSISPVSKQKTFNNPYLLFWAWSCYSLEYAGPNERTVDVKTSHHVLPIFMHHFGCLCPSYEALEIIRQLANGRTVLDIGSGNGYWSLMLRRQGCDVVGVDDGTSTYRTMWIGDTIYSDGISVLKKRGGAKEDVLLLVYPIVGHGFTKAVLDAYQGTIICVAGTQNMNGYTGFKDTLIDDWFANYRKAFQKIVQIPLPSFAGKDEALFVFKNMSG